MVKTITIVIGVQRLNKEQLFLVLPNTGTEYMN